MATTERRRSISGFFGFRQEPTLEAGSTPRLRRKLQKVSKQHIQYDGLDTGGVQTLKVPGDGLFLSTKYDAVPPPMEVEGVSSSENNRKSRDGRPVSFFRSSSLGRIASFRSRSASRTRTGSRTTSDAIDAIDAQPAPSTVPVTRPGSTGITQTASSAELQAVLAQEKAAQAATQTRTLQFMEAHERASRRNSFYGNGAATPAAQSPSAPAPSALLPMVAQPPPVTPPQQIPQFHRPYRHTQRGETSPPADKGRKHAYPPRSSNAFHKSMAAHYPSLSSSTASTISVSSSASSSIGSPGGSSTAFPSPTASSHSSAPVSPSSTLMFSPAYNNALPPSPPTSSASSSCPSDGFTAKSSPFSPNYGRHRNILGDFSMVPELSHLSEASSHSPAGPNFPYSPYSPASAATSVISSAPSQTTRRKVKTPVYAIGQLESAQIMNTSSTDKSRDLEQTSSRWKHDPPATGMQTPPRSPRSPRSIRSPRSPSAFRAAALPTTSAELLLLQSKSSIECIAEEYRALLASRNSQVTDARSEVGADAFHRTPAAAVCSNKHTRSGHYDRKATPGATERMPRQLMPSHRGQRSKMQPSQLPPLSTEYHHNCSYYSRDAGSARYAPPPPTQPDNLSLQISLDLLTRELSSALVQHPMPDTAERATGRAGEARNSAVSVDLHGRQQETVHSASSAGSALQILVMIEAYERLRDQLVADARASAKTKGWNGGRGNREHLRSDELEAMFSLWLRALYRMHDALTCASVRDKGDTENGSCGYASESEYDSVAE